MSELQTDEYVEEVSEDINQDVQTEDLQQNEGADLATDSDAEHEEKPKVDEKQAAIDKVISKKHFEAKEAERKAEEYRKQLEVFQARERESQAQLMQNIPPMPDPYDDDYETKMQSRDIALANKAQWDARQELNQQQTAYIQQQQQIEQQKVLNEKLSSYASKAKELNISSEELQTAASAVGAFNPPESLQMAIIQDKNGPLITKYLAVNPLETQALIDAVSINPILAGEKFAEIKANAISLKPKYSKAPAPSKRPTGGTANQPSSYVNGATYE